MEDAYAMGTSPSWKASDSDQFVLKERSKTDSIGPCISGGLSGRLKAVEAVFPKQAGLFHLVPTSNLRDESQLLIEKNITAIETALQGPMSGLVVGGWFNEQYGYHSRELASRLVSLLNRVMGCLPSKFTGQNSSTKSAVAYDGRHDTWYVQAYDTLAHMDTGSLDDVKRLFRYRHVNPVDTVYIGLNSDIPVPKVDLDSDS